MANRINSERVGAIGGLGNLTQLTLTDTAVSEIVESLNDLCCGKCTCDCVVGIGNMRELCPIARLERHLTLAPNRENGVDTNRYFHGIS